MAEGKILLILVVALLVLGPEKLPKLAADIGRWVGRARAMARQLQNQLDQEVQIQSVLREQTRSTTATAEAREPAEGGADRAAPAPSESTAADVMAPLPPAATADAPAAVDPLHSHAHGPGDAHPDYAHPDHAHVGAASPSDDGAPARAAVHAEPDLPTEVHGRSHA